ncbi:YfiM family lipoprotein [Buttiauxella sp. B2]|uniref:YfiM family lipoprotein n=1 Tax=Buttiauxella sp. B2 TaxID=2587812 RepID=UPI00111F9B6C|nr:YfiM family lipoprotein [Buttiauxella sp. B2]TNV20110.1 YfiM family lipoprotein [Buttiauxella sp. B2]
MLRLLLPSLFLLSGCSHMSQDQWHGQDKAQHFIASAILSAVGNKYGQHQSWSDSRSANFGFLFSVSLGATKELWDSRQAGSGWSWKDLTWDVAGAATGYAVWQLAKY